MTELSKRCDTCGKTYSPNCDYKQGRCPLHPPLVSFIILNKFKNHLISFFNKLRGKLG